MLDLSDYEFSLRLDEWNEGDVMKALTSSLDMDCFMVIFEVKRIELLFDSGIKSGTLKPYRVENCDFSNDLQYFKQLDVIEWAIKKEIPLDKTFIDFFNKSDKSIRNESTISIIQEQYISGELKILNDAAYQFWSNAEPEEKRTHTKQEIIEQWLIKKGFSKNKAETGASIIRPQWAAKGRI
jgi:hypothetical protein